MPADEKIDPGDPRPEEARLEAGSYEIIRGRLEAHGAELKDRLAQLNAARKKTFGAIELTLTGSERITTENNCVPRDVIPIGKKFLFGYNVHLGLRSEIQRKDVFAVYDYGQDGFKPAPLDLIGDQQFGADFKDLYKYYKGTTFAKFGIRPPTSSWSSR